MCGVANAGRADHPRGPLQRMRQAQQPAPRVGRERAGAFGLEHAGHQPLDQLARFSGEVLLQVLGHTALHGSRH